MTPEEGVHLLLQAQGDPKKLALAGVELLLSERPAIWRTVLQAAAIPHWFDSEILTHLLADDVTTPGAAEAMTALNTLPVVEPFRIRQARNVHETTRLALREHLAVEQPELFLALSQHAATYFSHDNRPSHRIESVFHCLAAAPEQAVKELGNVVRQWSNEGAIEPLQALAVAIDELKEFPKLDPAAQAMVFGSLAVIRWNHQPLEKTENLVDSALSLYKKLGDRRRQTVSLAQLGDIARQRDQLDLALEKYQLGLDLTKALTASEPANLEYARDLSISYEHLGSIYLRKEQYDDALREFRASTDASEKIAKQKPEDHFQRDVAISHSKIAEVHYAREDWAGALNELQISLGITRRLAADHPENIEFLYGFAINLGGVGESLLHLDRLSEALDHCKQSVTLAQQLVDQDPNHYERRRALSYFRFSLGDVLARRGQSKEALHEYLTARDIRQALTKLDPENIEWKRELAQAWIKIGDFLHDQGDAPGAQSHYKEALALSMLLPPEAAEKLRQKIAGLHPA